jgi:hypothetical protein
VSYLLESRSGTRQQFVDMVSRCNAVGVNVLVDLVINHMSGHGNSGTGSGGSSFDGESLARILFLFPLISPCAPQLPHVTHQLKISRYLSWAI